MLHLANMLHLVEMLLFTLNQPLGNFVLAKNIAVLAYRDTSENVLLTSLKRRFAY
jgi:hypothetical protein